MNKSKAIPLTAKTLCMTSSGIGICPFMKVGTEPYCKRYRHELRISRTFSVLKCPQCLIDFPGVIVMTSLKG